MNTARRRTYAAFFVFSAVASTALVGCGGGESPAPTTTTTTTTTTSPSPTEKGLNPSGGNKFSPTVMAPGPQTAAPGNLPGNAPKN